MRKWYCITCDFIYDEALGMPEYDIEPGTLFDDLPEDSPLAELINKMV